MLIDRFRNIACPRYHNKVVVHRKARPLRVCDDKTLALVQMEDE
jgi:hypothetical protein